MVCNFWCLPVWQMGEFVIEYCGEVISCEEARLRSQKYELEGRLTIISCFGWAVIPKLVLCCKDQVYYFTLQGLCIWACLPMLIYSAMHICMYSFLCMHLKSILLQVYFSIQALCVYGLVYLCSFLVICSLFSACIKSVNVFMLSKRHAFVIKFGKTWTSMCARLWWPYFHECLRLSVLSKVPYSHYTVQGTMWYAGHLVYMLLSGSL